MALLFYSILFYSILFYVLMPETTNLSYQIQWDRKALLIILLYSVLFCLVVFAMCLFIFSFNVFSQSYKNL